MFVAADFSLVERTDKAGTRCNRRSIAMKSDVELEGLRGTVHGLEDGSPNGRNSIMKLCPAVQAHPFNRYDRKTTQRKCVRLRKEQVHS